jgi:ribose transport system permease protein
MTQIPQSAQIVGLTLLLVLIGAVFAPATVSLTSVSSMVPFAAILGVAALGQHLVIQQRGLDLSVAGSISLIAVIITAGPGPGASGWTLTLFIAISLVAGAMIGAVNGAVVTYLRVPPLVATISMNSILIGLALVISGGRPAAANQALVGISFGSVLGIPNTVWILALVTALTVFLISSTVLGRRFVAVSVNARSAYAIGIDVSAYQIGTYIAAGVCYAAAAIVLSGYLSLPGIFVGNSYMLATVAAYVIAGNDIAGGRSGSFVATAVGAFFLTYLDQFLLALNFTRSSQLILQSLIVLAGVGIPVLVRSLLASAEGSK